MKRTTTVSVPRSVLLVMDPANGVVPETMNGRLVAATSSCIAVGTVSEGDGVVEIELTDELPEPDPEMRCVWKSELQTPGRELAVCSILGDNLLGIAVEHGDCDVRVWVNHATEPDRILVAVRPGSQS